MLEHEEEEEGDDDEKQDAKQEAGKEKMYHSEVCLLDQQVGLIASRKILASG